MFIVRVSIVFFGRPKAERYNAGDPAATQAHQPGRGRSEKQRAERPAHKTEQPQASYRYERRNERQFSLTSFRGGFR